MYRVAVTKLLRGSPGAIKLTSLVLAGLAGVAFVILLMMRPWGGSRILWAAPAGEWIAYVRTGVAPGHLLVLSERSLCKRRYRWYLREIDRKGRPQLLAAGYGKLQGPVPMSPMSWQHDRVLVGVRKDPKSLRTADVVECDVKGRTATALPHASWAGQLFTFPLRQSYSPDGRGLLLCGPCSSWRMKNIKADGIWLLDKRTGQIRLLRRVLRLQDVGWSPEGKVYVYERATGRLFHGRPPKLVFQRLLPAGQVGSMAPDGQRILIATGKPSVAIWEADLPKGKPSVLYHNRSWALALDVEWSLDGRQALVIMTGPHVRPVMVGPRSRAKVIELSCDLQANWRETAGAAFLRPGWIALVAGQPETDGPDRIVAVRVR